MPIVFIMYDNPFIVGYEQHALLVIFEEKKGGDRHQGGCIPVMG